MNISLNFVLLSTCPANPHVSLPRYVVLYEALLRLLGGRDAVTEAEQFWAGTV